MSDKIKKAKVEVVEQVQRVRGTKHFKMPKEIKRMAATILDRAERREFLNIMLDGLLNKPVGKKEKEKSE